MKMPSICTLNTFRKNVNLAVGVGHSEWCRSGSGCLFIDSLTCNFRFLKTYYISIQTVKKGLQVNFQSSDAIHIPCQNFHVVSSSRSYWCRSSRHSVEYSVSQAACGETTREEILPLLNTSDLNGYAISAEPIEKAVTFCIVYVVFPPSEVWVTLEVLPHVRSKYRSSQAFEGRTVRIF